MKTSESQLQRFKSISEIMSGEANQFYISTYMTFAEEIVKLTRPHDLQASLALDIGCGMGKYAHLVEYLGLPCIGLDSSTKSLKNASKFNLNLIRASATALPFRNGSFKMIICIELLHHLEDTYFGMALEEVQRMLNYGGWFILDVKNSINLILWVLYRMNSSSRILYTARSIFQMKNRLHQLGFAIDKTIAIPYPFPLPNLVRYIAPKILVISHRVGKINSHSKH
jgi:ubiquinone/menaquinone biosynthesis C-methylase UbiE